MKHHHPAAPARLRAAIWATALTLAFSATAQPPNDPAAMWNETTLYRDSYGVPHIQSASARGMAFAFGYAQAQDHLEPMLMAYRVALGRAAEVGGEPFAESDAFAVKIANAEVAAAAFTTADPITRDLCEGFALGVNAWLLENQHLAPAWAEGVQPKDVLAWWHYLMVASAPFDLPGVYGPPAPLERANAWALAPERTQEGAAILAMAPFQHHTGPYRWYEAHLMVGGVNWAGATLYGVPALMMGHNEHLGWALTPNRADTADFFQEDLSGPARNPASISIPSAIQDVAPLLTFMAAAKPYYVRTASGLVERAVPSHIGARGPIFEGADGRLYSWRNGNFQQFGGLRQLMMMGQATNLESFRAAAAMQQLGNFQILYADKAGELFYAYNARTGNKNAALADNEPRPVNWAVPQAAARDLWAWQAIIPFQQLPQITNPGSGFLQACGTPPWLATSNSGIDPAAWPGWLIPEQPSYRVFRVNQILSAGKYSFADMRAMHFDTLVPAAVDMVPLLLGMAEARANVVKRSHPDLAAALALLRGWDLQANPESQATAFYTIWWNLMLKRHAAQFQNEAGLYQALLANSEQAQGYALDAAAEAARVMRNDFNAVAVPWGQVHRIHRGNRNEAMPGASAGDSLFYAGNAAFANRQWHANFSYGFAMTVQFTPETRAASIVPFGASESPVSPNFADQMGLFLDRRMKRTHFQHSDVIRNAAVGFGSQVALGAPGVLGFCALSMDRPSAVKMEAIPEPPRPYPGGRVPFGPAIRPLFDGPAPNHAWTVELYVPEDICEARHQNQLRLYTYSQESGWLPIAGQRYNPDNGAFTGGGAGRYLIAILGPNEYKLEPAPEPEDVLVLPATIADATPSPDFLRAPPIQEQPVPAQSRETIPDPRRNSRGNAAPDGPPEGVAGASVEFTPPAPPANAFYDVEYLDGGRGPEQPPELAEQPEKKRGVLAPFRKLLRGKSQDEPQPQPE